MQGERRTRTLADALHVECCNGLGFDTNPRLGEVYLGQPYLATPVETERGMPSCEIRDWDAFNACLGEGARVISWIGHDFVEVRVADFELVPTILGRLLADGRYTLWMQTGGGSVRAQLRPGDDPSRAGIERAVVRQLERECEEVRSYHTGGDPEHHYLSTMVNKKALKTYNWVTPEGRAWCHAARLALGKRAESAGRDRFAWDWFPGVVRDSKSWWFEGCDLPIVPAVTHAATPPAQESMDECMICLDRAPSTIARPCGHRVVCAPCSRELARTPDHHTCVQCRRAITHADEE